MYDNHPRTDNPQVAASKAALWTPEAQAKHKELTSLPDTAQALVRMQIGYLEAAKTAAEQHEANQRKGL
ncbi:MULTISPECIES: hypothetical protein [unclassified Arthrobacter]|uniref:hypothetical protein n=1 Tax=unclassified Arthrobacter TaxID=235627 RepID=UPI001C850B87|nr:hypothetical protein [Arthrobacter sp. MAHUQ-56]MBX7445459.1 hypothetical protein [Arthrobacter sp. MAHUQ-56]